MSAVVRQGVGGLPPSAVTFSLPFLLGSGSDGFSSVVVWCLSCESVYSVLMSSVTTWVNEGGALFFDDLGVLGVEEPKVEDDVADASVVVLVGLDGVLMLSLSCLPFFGWPADTAASGARINVARPTVTLGLGSFNLHIAAVARRKVSGLRHTRGPTALRKALGLTGVPPLPDILPRVDLISVSITDCSSAGSSMTCRRTEETRAACPPNALSAGRLSSVVRPPCLTNCKASS